MQLVHVSRWNRSHASIHVRLVRALHPTIPMKQDKTSSGKKVDNINDHNKLCSTHARELRIDLALIPLLVNVAENKKFPTVSPRSIYEFI